MCKNVQKQQTNVQTNQKICKTVQNYSKNAKKRTKPCINRIKKQKSSKTGREKNAQMAFVASATFCIYEMGSFGPQTFVRPNEVEDFKHFIIFIQSDLPILSCVKLFCMISAINVILIFPSRAVKPRFKGCLQRAADQVFKKSIIKKL